MQKNKAKKIFELALQHEIKVRRARLVQPKCHICSQHSSIKPVEPMHVDGVPVPIGVDLCENCYDNVRDHITEHLKERLHFD